MKLIQILVQLATYVIQGILVASMLFLTKIYPKTLFNIFFDVVIFSILGLIVKRMVGKAMDQEKAMKWIRLFLAGSLCVLSPLSGSFHQPWLCFYPTYT